MNPPVCETFSQNRFFLNDGFPNIIIQEKMQKLHFYPPEADCPLFTLLVVGCRRLTPPLILPQKTSHIFAIGINSIKVTSITQRFIGKYKFLFLSDPIYVSRCLFLSE